MSNIVTSNNNINDISSLSIMIDLSIVDLSVKPSDPNGGEIMASFVMSSGFNGTNTVDE